MIDATLLKITCPENSLIALSHWVEQFPGACVQRGMDTSREVPSSPANLDVESCGPTNIVEDLNYSAERMAEVWPSRLAISPDRSLKNRQPNALAKSFAHDPEKLANHVYADRMRNGPPASGGEWCRREFGPKQLTLTYNHRRLAAAFNIHLDEVPDIIRTHKGGAYRPAGSGSTTIRDAEAPMAGIETSRTGQRCVAQRE